MISNLAIFDLDGTLLNTIADLGVACNYALSKFNYPLHEPTEYPHLVGNGVNKLIERALPQEAKSEDIILKLKSVFVPFYNTHNMVHTHPYEGIIEVLEQLRERGYRLAVASNKYQAATEALVKHYFPNTFDVILGERENCARKPDPQIVKDIINSLDCPLNQIFYIGDSDVDIQTAKNAKLPVLACTWGFCEDTFLRTYEPNYIINEPKQILDIL